MAACSGLGPGVVGGAALVPREAGLGSSEQGQLALPIARALSLSVVNNVQDIFSSFRFRIVELLLNLINLVFVSLFNQKLSFSMAPT